MLFLPKFIYDYYHFFMLKYIFVAILSSFFLFACEEEYIPETLFERPEVVVEGYLEMADNALPPYVLLTKSQAYSSTFDTETLNNLFIHDADVWVSDGTDSVKLTEICLADLAILDTVLRNSVAQGLGLNAGGAFDQNLNLCAYIDANAFITGQPSLVLVQGKTYFLRINVPNQPTITAQTTMPRNVPLDSVWYQNHPKYPENDSLVQVTASFLDPANEQNYYRVFSKRNSEPIYPASTLGVATSVTDDNIFNGQGSSFTLQRGQAISTDFDPNTFGYFWRGDTVILRAASLDYEHFRFWQTLEYNSNSQGPFANYVRVKSNINNALGVFGAIAYQDYQLIIPR
jgi:Domain of unknown function (DUF4249)